MFSSLFRIIVAVGLLAPVVSSNRALGEEKKPIQFAIEEKALDNNVQIEPTRLGAKFVDVVRIKGEQAIVVPTEPSAPQEIIDYKSFSPEVKAEANFQRRSILKSVLQVITGRSLKGTTLVKDSYAYTYGPTKVSLNENNAEVAQPLSDLVGATEAGPVRKSSAAIAKEKLKSFVVFLNDALIGSTIRALKNHLATYKKLTPEALEYGVEVMLKGEFQFGMGKFNITKNLPLMLRIGYNREKGVLLRTGFRKEAMSGGTAVSAGVKFELRRYRMVASSDQSKTITGANWYPPSVPLVSFVADSAPGYSAEGITVGINVADFIPGSTFINTVNSFQENVHVYEPLRVASSLLKKFIETAEARSQIRTSSQGYMCRQIFAF